MVSMVIPERLAEMVRRAEELGVSLEEYLLDALTRDLDPDESAREYVEVVRNLVE